MDDIFKIAKQLRKDNQDVVGDKCVKDDSGNLSFDNEAKKVAWKQHYERLLGLEIDSDLSFTNHLNSVLGKVLKKLNALSRLCALLPFHRKRALTHSFIVSQFN